MRSKAHSALTAPLVLHHARIYKCAMKKIIYNGQVRNDLFSIVIYHSSLVKAAVNGLRICKLRRDHLTGTGHGATLLFAPLEYATTSHQFFIFHLLKAEQGPIAYLPITEGLIFRSYAY
jgi:hypothetical protein